MTRDEALALLKFRLGNLRGHDEVIQTEMVSAQIRLERMPELPWFLLTENTSLTTTANVASLTLPTDFLREAEDWGFWITDSEAVLHPLEKTDYIDFTGSENYYSDETGLPSVYDILGENSLRLAPTPDAAYALTLYYYATDQTLTSNLENKWLKYYPDLLIAEAGHEICRTLRDASRLQTFADSLKTEMMRLGTENVARREAGRTRTLGG